MFAARDHVHLGTFTGHWLIENLPNLPRTDSTHSDSAHQRRDKKIVTQEERFSPHDLKRKGITDTPGTGAEKKDAAGLSEAMMKTYDLSRLAVKPSATR